MVCTWYGMVYMVWSGLMLWLGLQVIVHLSGYLGVVALGKGHSRFKLGLVLEVRGLDKVGIWCYGQWLG
jgi:hypothetical protein